MSAEPRFVDTNVLVYLFDSGAPDKQTRARDLLREEQDRLVVSVQVLGEDQHPLAASVNAVQDAANRIEPGGPREVDLRIALHRVGRLGMKRDATDVVKQFQRGTARTIHEVLSGKLVGFGLG